MIHIVEGLPSNVVAVRAEGWVRASDYREVLIPAVDATLKRHDKIRLYYELGEAFKGIELGAVFEDAKIGLAKFPHWEKLAVVTNVGWIARAVSAFGFLVPGMVRLFSTSESSEALDWIQHEA